MPQKERYQVQCPAIGSKFAALWAIADHNISSHCGLVNLSPWFLVTYSAIWQGPMQQEVLLLNTLKKHMQSAPVLFPNLGSAYYMLMSSTQETSWPVGQEKHGPCTFPLLNLAKICPSLTFGLL